MTGPLHAQKHKAAVLAALDTATIDSFLLRFPLTFCRQVEEALCNVTVPAFFAGFIALYFRGEADVGHVYAGIIILRCYFPDYISAIPFGFVV